MGGSGLKMLTKVKNEIGWEKVGVDRSGWKWAGPWFRTTHQKSELLNSLSKILICL